jgi:ATP-dependent helicase/nuclease subunit B
MNPRVFTIPSGVPFSDALAAGLIARTRSDSGGADPLALSRMTLLLPNRRAGRAMADAFLRRADAGGGVPGGGLLLPKLQPIGEPDEDAQTISDQGLGDSDAADLPPAIGGLRRQMMLAQLIHRSPQARLVEGAGPMPFDQALRLAAELARLIDQVATERLDFSRVRDLAPADSVYWQLTVRFLDLVQEHWPHILAAEGALDPAVRRNLLLERQCAQWRARPPAGPVIAAGSTGSIPASADLIALVAGLPQGMVVLPGLDRDADPAAWEAIAIDQSHPQHGLAQLLKRLGLAPAEVGLWPCDGFPAAAPSRAAIVSGALLPAEQTERWSVLAESLRSRDPQHGWAGVSRVDCSTEQEEAGVIALLLREAVERPAPQRAALVTPDRGLARRVKAELARWGIAIDDSAGEPLRLTAPGAFFLLIAEAAAEEWSPVPLLALLKHPLAAAGRAPNDFRAAVRQLERAVLRGPRPAAGLAGLKATIDDMRQAARHENERVGLRQAAAFIGPLIEMAAAFAEMSGPAPLATRLEAHVRLAEALAASDAEPGTGRLWRNEAGEGLADFIAELRDAGRDAPALDAADYVALLRELMAGVAVRPRYGLHPRLFIWGPLEARLQQAELLVLGGLNEGTWPPEPAIDPWLSRPMRAEFGLPAPDRRIGLSAHDFQQAMGAPRVVLTRSLRAAGQPTVPARWLLRFEAFLRLLGVEDDRRAAVWRGWQRNLDRAEMVQPIKRPEPRPGAKRRPDALSVTQIETWMRDPYSIYARHILKLKPLDPIDQDPDLSDLGTIVHQALHRFVAAYPDALPEDALDRLLEIGRREFAPHESRPAVMAFWWPRFEKIARWFVETETELRPSLEESRTELEGAVSITEVKPPFTLKARADRIDRLDSGELVLIDYKTGAAPGHKEVMLGLSPQLSLEAAIALEAGFKDLAYGRVARLEYWRLSGGAVPGEIKEVRQPGRAGGPIDPNALAEEAREGLVNLLHTFGTADAAYPPAPRAEYAPRYNDYEHLARIAEWTVNETDEEAGEFG